MSALWALQFLDSLLGAAGAGLMHAVLRREGISQRVSALSALGMALSTAYWLSALEAQVYMMGAFFLVGTLGEALRERPAPIRLALWHAAAMLSHGANALAAPAALYAIFRSRCATDRTKDALRYFLTAASIVVAAYVLSGIFFVRPTNGEEVWIWLAGTAAIGQKGGLHWLFGEFYTDIANWIRLCIRVISPFYVLALPVWGAAFWTLWKDRSGDQKITWTAVLWLVPYALFFSRWESLTLHFRVNDLLPLWLLAAAAVNRAEMRRGVLPLYLAFIGLLGAANLGADVLSRSDPEKNQALQEAKWIKSSTPENAWVVAEHIDEVYIPYFAHRKPLILRYAGNVDEVTERLWNLLEKGEPVYITSRRLKDNPSLPRGLKLRASGKLGRTNLYRITAIAQ